MLFVPLYVIFLLELLVNFTYESGGNLSNNNRTSPWSCYLSSERRLNCRNLYNFYFSSQSLCANDYNVLIRQRIDEIHISNDYNCLDHSYHCYFEFDSSWTLCLDSLRKLTIENLSFVIRFTDKRKLLPIDYLKIVNTHGSITELLHLFQFSNRSSVYIENGHPRWSGMDIYSIYLLHKSVLFKQLWINILDWYPIVYMKYDQQISIREWLFKIPCLHIELGECHSYYYDMIFLRDLFALRQENYSQLYCYSNHGAQRFHWSQVPDLSYNYIRPLKPISNFLSSTGLREECFEQFTKVQFTINSYTDFQEFYSHFNLFQYYSIPIKKTYKLSNVSNLPINPALRSGFIDNHQSYSSKTDYVNLYKYKSLLNERRWLSSIDSYPDGRFILLDNRNQQLLLLNENGTFFIDLTPILCRQIQLTNSYQLSTTFTTTIDNIYTFSKIFIDHDSFIYIISKVAYSIYVFSQDNRLIRYLTPKSLGISIIRSDCFAVTYTGLIYICDDTYRLIRIYSRMGILQKTIRLDYLPLKLFISNNRLFTYSIEYVATINMYTLSGLPVQRLKMCSYDLPSEVLWFRGKYFLTCGIVLYILDEDGRYIAEENLQIFVNSSTALVKIYDTAINKNGLLIVTLLYNGTLLNRYWVIRPMT